MYTVHGEEMELSFIDNNYPLNETKKVLVCYRKWKTVITIIRSESK